MARRKIIKIDEEKCDGCGRCVPACAEGAIQIVGGKAKLISEVYCDGLGDCIAECPQGALTTEEREAEEFNEITVEKHLARKKDAEASHYPDNGCPGTAARTIKREVAAQPRISAADAGPTPSALSNWPVQLHLVPAAAPFFDGAELVVSADCVPFSYADFHQKFLARRTLLVGCPKLDDAEAYLHKLTRILQQNDIRSVEVVYMEVPCCFGMTHIVRKALKESGKDIPLAFTMIGIRGEILETGGAE